jgi:hypothetical protein
MSQRFQFYDPIIVVGGSYIGLLTVCTGLCNVEPGCTLWTQDFATLAFIVHMGAAVDDVYANDSNDMI